MSKGYTANFKTEGNWIIPFLFGYSKSTVLMGVRPIGIMYTIHITPYFNIGVNNPKPKFISDQHTNEITEAELDETYKHWAEDADKRCSSPCECEADICNCDRWADDERNEDFFVAIDLAYNFVNNSDHNKVLGFYPLKQTPEGKEVFHFIVSDLNVEVPEEMNGYKTKKFIKTLDEK